MIAIVNPRAGAGQGLARWRLIEPSLRARFGPLDVRTLDQPDALPRAVRDALGSDDRRIIMAGGDGTVNAVVHELLAAHADRSASCTLGAVGLGSSNDMHKPSGAGRSLAGFPARLDFARATRCDAGCVTLTCGGTTITRHFFLNASAGITAEGNRRFNAPGPVLGALKRLSTPGAIAYAALSSLLLYRNIPVRLTMSNGKTTPLLLTNLGVVRSPYFSGDLHYDAHATAAGGTFTVVACERMGIPARYALFRSLQRGTVDGLAHVRSWVTSELTLTAPRPVTIEFDGETATAERAQFSIIPEALEVCP